ncbi:MAG: branched-chain amino acid ABC transporter permease [Deltaproteobacteria bacterium]
MKRAAVALVVAALLLAPALLPSEFYVNIATQVLIAAIFALSLNLLVGYTGLISLGHGVFLGVAAYLTIGLTTRLGMGQLPAALAALALTTALAAAFAPIALRATGLGFLMITLALGQILWGLAYRWVQVTGGDNGLSGFARPSPLGLDLGSPRLFYLFSVAIFACAFFFIALLVSSPFGAGLRGVRDQPRRLRALGWDTWLLRYLAFVIAGFWGAVAGVLYAYYNQFVSPHVLGLPNSAEALLMVIAGGAGTLSGPLAGAVVVVLLKNVASAYVTRWMMLLGTVFVVIVIFVPEGLVPGFSRLRRKVRAA